jgi:hypothetical protein
MSTLHVHACERKAGENNLPDGMNMIEPMHEVYWPMAVSQADLGSATIKKVVTAIDPLVQGS